MTPTSEPPTFAPSAAPTEVKEICPPLESTGVPPNAAVSIHRSTLTGILPYLVSSMCGNEPFTSFLLPYLDGRVDTGNDLPELVPGNKCTAFVDEIVEFNGTIGSALRCSRFAERLELSCSAPGILVLVGVLPDSYQVSINPNGLLLFMCRGHGRDYSASPPSIVVQPDADETSIALVGTAEGFYEQYGCTSNTTLEHDCGNGNDVFWNIPAGKEVPYDNCLQGAIGETCSQ